MDLSVQNRASPPNPTNQLNTANIYKRRCQIQLQLQLEQQQQHQQQQIHQHEQQNQQHQEEQQQHHQQNQEQHQQHSHNHHHQQHQHQNNKLIGSPFKDSSTLNLTPINDDLAAIIREELNQPSRNDPPVLSLRQTQIICEKLIQLREQRLREEYDKILINKLTEQHDTFVRYTHDHIERQFNSTIHQDSYLS